MIIAKREARVASAALFVLIACATSAPGAGAGRLDVLTNGGFEAFGPGERLEPGGTRGAAGWTVETRGRASIRPDTRDPAEGASAMRIDVSGAAHASLISDATEIGANSDWLISARYRSQGFSTDGGFQGVNAWLEIRWLDRDGRQLGKVDLGAPYREVAWGPVLAVVASPAGASRARVSMNLDSEARGMPSSVWIDDVRLRPWRPAPLPGATPQRFAAGEGRIHGHSFRLVADDDTETEFSVYANPRYAVEAAYLIDGAYIADLEAGPYRLDFRLRVGASAQRAAVVNLNVVATSVHNRVLRSLDLRPAEIGPPPEYHDVTLRVAHPGGSFQPLVRWLGGAPLWLDTITLTREQLPDAEYFDDVFAE